jgi:DMSO/TMAO reductase YedYZ molybdopterin-dependent catalytic subunit
MTPEQELAQKTRRGFISLGVGAVVVGAGAYGIKTEAANADDGVPEVLRSVMGVNEKLVRSTIYGNDHLVKTYPASAIGKLKKNGDIGMDTDLDAAAWRLEVGGKKLALDDVKSLPLYEETIDFKCVEGWSTVTHFAGARLSDFTAKFAPGSEKLQYVSFATPDKGYYVGIDMPSALHPQTLLAYDMNGAPLTEDHGAPLRLVIPVKYGIKNIKRIARIAYTDQRPADYWYEQGYDYYSGL